MKTASTLSDDTAPSASLDHLEAQAAPTQHGAPPEPLRSLQWPQEPASGRPKVEFSPLSTSGQAVLAWLLVRFVGMDLTGLVDGVSELR